MPDEIKIPGEEDLQQQQQQPRHKRDLQQVEYQHAEFAPDVLNRPVVSSSLRGVVATCTWSLPTRFRGHRLAGLVEIDANGETLVSKRFHVRVPKG